LRREGNTYLSHKIGGVELPKKLAGGVVRETKISVAEFLIEDGCAEKTAHLLFFDQIAWDGQNMTAPEKDSTGDLPIERGEKCKRALFKGENGIATAKLDAIHGSEVINVRGVDPQSLDDIKQFMRRSFRGRQRRRRQETPQRDNYWSRLHT
jgi:hypothetical protein